MRCAVHSDTSYWLEVAKKPLHGEGVHLDIGGPKLRTTTAKDLLGGRRNASGGIVFSFKVIRTVWSARIEEQGNCQLKFHYLCSFRTILGLELETNLCSTSVLGRRAR